MLSQLLRLKSYLLIPPILLWRSSSHPNAVICFIVISTYHILYSSVLQRKTFEQHLRHEYFFAFSQAFVQHSISLIFNALCLINLYAKYYYFTTKIRLRSLLSWEQTFFSWDETFALTIKSTFDRERTRPPQSFRLIMSGSAGFNIKFFSYASGFFFESDWWLVMFNEG